MPARLLFCLLLLSLPACLATNPASIVPAKLQRQIIRQRRHLHTPGRRVPSMPTR